MSNCHNLTNKASSALIYLFIAALAGTFLRAMVVYPINWFNYKYLLHTHSHIAMLGWVYLALFTGLHYAYFFKEAFSAQRYQVLFILTHVSVIGMLVTFTMQGYGAFSIAFSTLHILLSYYWIYCFIKDTRQERGISIWFTRAALFFLFFSSFGPWGLAVIASNGMKGSDLYKQAIYFYLHFQYNAWFIFALAGIILRKMEMPAAGSAAGSLKTAFWLLFLATFPGYFLSLLEFELPVWIYISGLIAGGLLLIGAGILLNFFRKYQQFFMPPGKPLIKWLWILAAFSFAVKSLLQFAGGLPYLTWVFHQRALVIGFLHLIMLGLVTPALFAYFFQNKFRELSGLSQAGTGLYLAGFIVTEVLLFLQGTPGIFISPANFLLLLNSMLMLLGIGMLLPELKERGNK